MKLLPGKWGVTLPRFRKLFRVMNPTLNEAQSAELLLEINTILYGQTRLPSAT